MARLRAFDAYRVQAKWLKEVVALPYDVMNDQEAIEMVAQQPYSFLRVDKPEIQQEEDPYVYAGKQLNKMFEMGIYKQDEKSLYIYELESKWAHQYGLVGLVSAKEYDAGIIKKHENTRIDKEQGRVSHILSCSAHTGPIFLIEQSIENFGQYLKDLTKQMAPILATTFEDDVTHKVYQISEPRQIEALVKAFEKVPALYIADGHHRAAAAATVARQLPNNKEAQDFLAVIFPKEQLKILPYHRLVKDESGLTQEALFEKLEKVFKITPLDEKTFIPENVHTFGMCYKGCWYKLEVWPKIYIGQSVPKQLDAAILQNEVLCPLFHIQNPKSDPRIDFIAGEKAQDVLDHAPNHKGVVTFSVYPTTMEQLLAVADANALMPPKSTWFEPKLRSGLFIHRF